MKGLLHSKLFRKNLFKWIFMYVTVIGLFTSVVTYSKYISSMNSDDSARVASFDVSITYDGICENLGENEICNNGTFRPTSKISYYFTVDTRGLEVSTVFVTRISVLEYFKNIQIYDVTESEVEVIPDSENIVEEDNVKRSVFSLVDNDLRPNETYVRKYKVTMDFNYGEYDSDYSESHQLTGAVIVGYSATQKK